MLADSKGYVAIFAKPFDQNMVEDCVTVWLDIFDSVEQIMPGKMAGNLALKIESLDDLKKDQHPQFRVSKGEDFAWVYMCMKRTFVETTGLPIEENIMPLEVLMDLPELEEVVDQHDEKRLEELEKEGIID